MPECRRCHVLKSDRAFYRRSDAKTSYRVCKDCSRAYQRKRRIDLPDYQRARYLKRYGLSLAQYKQMLLVQKGLCAMCFGKQERSLSVDHHHASGKVRELLCGSCNALLGLAREDIKILKAAIEYLQKHSFHGISTTNGDGATHRHET